MLYINEGSLVAGIIVIESSLGAAICVNLNGKNMIASILENRKKQEKVMDFDICPAFRIKVYV